MKTDGGHVQFPQFVNNPLFEQDSRLLTLLAQACCRFFAAFCLKGELLFQFCQTLISILNTIQFLFAFIQISD